MERSELNERIESCINEHCSGDGNGELKTVATAIRMAEKKGIPVREVKVQKPVPPPKIKTSKSPAVALSPEHKERYAAAHQKYQRETTPAAYKDFGALPTQFPKTNTANGLTTFITEIS